MKIGPAFPVVPAMWYWSNLHDDWKNRQVPCAPSFGVVIKHPHINYAALRFINDVLIKYSLYGTNI